MLFNCDAGETFESPLDNKVIEPVSPKGNQSWMFIGRTDGSWSSNLLATRGEDPTHWKRIWCWERLKAGGEWDGYTASSTQWTWIWANAWRYPGTEEPGTPQSVGSRRIGRDLGTEQTTNVYIVFIKCAVSFLSLYIHIYWSILASECCVSFHCWVTWISSECTHIPSFLEILPV